MRPNLPGKVTHFRAGFGPTVVCGANAGDVRFIRTLGRDVNCKRCIKTKAYKRAHRERSTKP